MHSATSKVLHEVAGRASLWHVLRAAKAARPGRIAVVVAHDADDVSDAVTSWKLRPAPIFVDQGVPRGTGHAVMAAEAATDGFDDVLVVAGDDPLVGADDVRTVLRIHRRTRAAATILTTRVDDPTGYGRVIRRDHQLVDIVQESDASPEVKRIDEVATLVYAFRREDLYRALPLVGRDNRQREYYLPDVLAILLEKGEKVAAVPADFGGALGLNTRAGLAKAARVMRDRLVSDHMRAGVTFVDPSSTYLDVDVRIGEDTVIQPNTYLHGATRIGRGCTIGPESLLRDATVGDRAEVTFSVVRGARIGPGATVGPFASLRPGTRLAEGAKAGTFVEIKGSRVGRRSKVPHLAYVGDAVIGEDANLGAGTVTVNYDGFAKHRTVVEDGARVGSDTMLVAPVRVGRRAWTGAGSVITRDVPAGALAVERSEQRVVRGYDERKRAAAKAREPVAGKAARRGSDRRRSRGRA